MGYIQKKMASVAIATECATHFFYIYKQKLRIFIMHKVKWLWDYVCINWKENTSE